MSDSNPDIGTQDWYTLYYNAAMRSSANAEYCRRLFGQDLCQQGFAEMEHLDHLIAVTGLHTGQCALDLGCGIGGISEYISDQTGAHLTGVDFIPAAIQQALERTAAKRQRLDFQVMDIARLDFDSQSFDLIISIDTLYFTDLVSTLRQMAALCVPDGQMAIFYSHGWHPGLGIAVEDFPRESLPPDQTPLALALQACGLSYQAWDYSPEDREHAQRKQALAEEFKEAFLAEDNRILYENHAGEAAGVLKAYEAGAAARYLYHVTPHGPLGPKAWGA